ncbi:MAG: hypothetical protein R2716_08840 [Microthrixaceae bacterium]
MARALVERPEIIFADEPTGNLDSHSSAEILGFMRSTVDEFAQSVVMVTHDPVAATYADRVLFLNDGRTRGRGGRPDQGRGSGPHGNALARSERRCGTSHGATCARTSTAGVHRGGGRRRDRAFVACGLVLTQAVASSGGQHRAAVRTGRRRRHACTIPSFDQGPTDISRVDA